MPIELFRDPVWQFAGVVFSVLAIGATFLVYFWQRERRELAFGTFYQANLLRVSGELTPRLKVYFDGQNIPNLQVVVIALKNSGNRAVLKSDFERDLRIDLGAGVHILSADVSREFPANLAADVRVQSDHVFISPLLLNPNDYMLIKLLASGPAAEPQADARIVGISGLVPIKRSEEIAGWKKVRQNVVLLPALCVFFIGLAYWSGQKTNLQAAAIISLVLVPYAVAQWLMEHLRNHAPRYVDGA